MKQDSSIQCDRSASSCSSSSSEDTSSKLTRRKKLKPFHLSGSQQYSHEKQYRGQRFPNGSSDGQSVSSLSSSIMDHHTSAHYSIHMSYDFPQYLERYKSHTVFRKPLRKTLSLPDCFKDSSKLQHPGLTEGDREYLRHKAAVYSMADMKRRVQSRFRQAVQHQIDTGFHTQEEFQKYFDYIDRPRKKQFVPDDKVWRNPPKITPRPLHFHHRSATAPPGFRSQSAMEIRPDHNAPARPKSSHTNPSCQKDAALYYDLTTKRTLYGKKKTEPKM